MLRILVVSGLLFCTSVHAQLTDAGVGFGLQYTPTDYFLQVSCATSKPRFQKSAFLGLGINRTFFQQRFYPEIGFQLAYIVNQQQIRVLPYAQISVTRLRITDNNAHYWLNPELGIRLEYHENRDFGVQFGFRNLNEFWFLDKKGHNSLAYGFTGGIYFRL